MFILLLSDIHANFPALEAVSRRFAGEDFDAVLNCGDTTVYAAHPNECMAWLRGRGAVSILGNTDRKVLKLLRGKNFKKPRKAEKRIMYTWTARELDPRARRDLESFPRERRLDLGPWSIAMHHGSPASADEHLFDDTPGTRFAELARKVDVDIVLTGHSHTPYHKKVRRKKKSGPALVHFINPGSVGRMFDGDPRASCAVLELDKERLRVHFYRLDYDVERTVARLAQAMLPPIYADMFRMGRKLN